MIGLIQMGYRGYIGPNMVLTEEEGLRRLRLHLGEVKKVDIQQNVCKAS